MISNPTLPTAEIGIATLDELQPATTAVNKGPPYANALTAIKQVQAGFVI